jgi:hypothetical protein
VASAREVEVRSSVCVAVLWVTSSIRDTALLMCSLPLDCSPEAAAISPTKSATRLAN